MSWIRKNSLYIHVGVMAFLSILITWITYSFNVGPYHQVISHPQFNHFNHLDQYKDIIMQSGMWNWYRSFFIVDLLWAPAVLLLIFRLVTIKTKQSEKKWTALVWILLVSSILAYVFDILENISYLSIPGQLLSFMTFEEIVNRKNLFYALVIFSILLFLYQYFVYPRLSEIRRSIRATRYSLIIIILLLLLSTQMDQGSTVIIHLLQNPLNIIAALIFLNVLALACAHYPDYIDMNLNSDPNATWDMKPEWMKKLGIAFILYTYQNVSKSLKTNQAPQRQASNTDFDGKNFISHFRKSTGGILWLTWLYTLLFIFNKYADIHFSVNKLIILFALGYGFLYHVCNRTKKEWEIHFSLKQGEFEEAITNPNIVEKEKQLHKLIKPRFRIFFLATLLSFLLVIVLASFTIHFAYLKDWEMSGMFLFLTSGINLIFYIFFQHFRKVYSYYTTPVYLRWLLIQNLNDDYVYIVFFSLMGLIGLNTIIYFTTNPSCVNPLVFIIIFFYLYYGFFTILLKHHIYYKAPDTHKANTCWLKLEEKFFISYVPILPLLIFAWFVFAGQAGNKLHVLHPVSPQGDEVSLNAYLKKYAEIHDSTKYHPFFLATYGGGLRASVWTMLLLEKMEENNSRFYNSTLAMSGVSGGFVGLSMYNAIRKEYHDKNTIRSKIDTIGRHNILSIEVSYLLGADLVRDMQPYRRSFRYTDRAGRSMREYASLVQPDAVKRDTILKTGFRDYWRKGYDQSFGGFIPALIGNTTGTHGRYGVAFSVRPDTFNKVFPAAADILTVSNGSIKYLDATSTTERFPLFSPSGQIEEKGNFLDGGYFENSGLLSLMNFYSYIQKNNSDSIPLDSARIILIINSKESYIRHVLGDSVIAKNEISAGELMAIVSTVANIDVLPLSLEEKCKNDFGKNFILIYLPYPISYSDVTSLIRGEPDDPIDIQKKINASNATIDSTWNRYFKGSTKVPPALARVLSDPAVQYLHVMIHHPEVQAQLNKLKYP
ncbi:MAG: hypothetical protein ABJB16_16160 [Saprospiraceae bacterium]